MIASYKIKQQPEDFIVKEVSSASMGKEGNFSYLLMKKRNMNTIDAVQSIADFLRIPNKHIGFAGNKDKIAVTEQYISVPAGQEKRLADFRNPCIELEFLGKGRERISLGDLEGNNFEITARECSKEPKKLERFVNYFGEQRFSRNNIDIGRYIIKGKLEKAAMVNMEKDVISHLRNHPKDYVGALKNLPKKLLTLYINAYQSYLWNTAVKEYLKEAGKKDISKYFPDDLSVEVIGFGTEFKDKRIEKIYDKIMEKEDITLRDFIVRRMPDLSSEGADRKVFAESRGLKIEKIGGKTYRLSFFLPKGCYATELIRQMFE